MIMSSITKNIRSRCIQRIVVEWRPVPPEEAIETPAYLFSCVVAQTEAHFACLIEHGNEVDHSHACDECLRLSMRTGMRKISAVTRDLVKVSYSTEVQIRKPILFGVEHIHIPGNEVNEGMTGSMVRLGVYFGVALLVRACIRNLGGQNHLARS
jgi:hypothetical protein